MSENECAICYEAGEPEAIVSSLPCGHAFHKTCVIDWLNTSNEKSKGTYAECPTCRNLFCAQDVRRIYNLTFGRSIPLAVTAASSSTPSGDSELNECASEQHRVLFKYSDPSVTEEDLEEYLSAFPVTVTSIKICQTHDKKDKGYAILFVPSADNVGELIQHCHNQDWRGYRLQVEAAKSKEELNKSSIFISNLKANVKEAQLRKVFEACGEIVHVKVNAAKPGKTALTAIIGFKQSDSVTTAIRTMNGKHVLGNKVYVKEFKLSTTSPPKAVATT